MHGTLQQRAKSATKSAAACGTESPVGSDSETFDDGDDWFGSIARHLLGKDAGHALAFVSGVPEGSCYKYTTTQSASRRQPPGYLIRQLLRSEQGGQFLDALMHGSDAGWWRDVKRARRIADFIGSLE